MRMHGTCMLCQSELGWLGANGQSFAVNDTSWHRMGKGLEAFSGSTCKCRVQNHHCHMGHGPTFSRWIIAGAGPFANRVHLDDYWVGSLDFNLFGTQVYSLEPTKARTLRGQQQPSHRPGGRRMSVAIRCLAVRCLAHGASAELDNLGVPSRPLSFCSFCFWV